MKLPVQSAFALPVTLALITFGTIHLSGISASAATFTWEGDVNEFWGTSGNWSPNGVPDDNDKIVFVDNSPGNPSGITDVELDGNRTVKSILFEGIHDYTLLGSVNTDKLTLTTGDITTTGTATHTIRNTMILGNNGDWTIGNPLLQVKGEVAGNSSLRKFGAGTLSLLGDNTYSGGTSIIDGKLILGSDNAAGTGIIGVAGTDSSPTIEFADGVEIANDIAMASNLHLGMNNGSSATYSGTITGDSDTLLIYDGNGTLTFTGGTNVAPSSVGYLASDGGDLILDGAHINTTREGSATAGLLADGGSITIQNGANVQVSATVVDRNTITITGDNTSFTGDASFYVGDADSSVGHLIVQDGASLDLAETLVTGSLGHGEIIVRDGATVTANRMMLSILDGGYANALVTGSGTQLSLTSDLFLGGQTSSSLGGTGVLTVDNGADIQVVGLTRFFTSSSKLTINGGVFETDELSNLNGTTPTISISGNDALTVGTNNGSSTYSGFILDAGGAEPGRLRKTGTGTFTLTGGTDATPSNFGSLFSEDGSVVIDGARIDLTSTQSLNTTKRALVARDGDITIQNGADVRLQANTQGYVSSQLTITGEDTSLSGWRLEGSGDNGVLGNITVEDGAALDLEEILLVGFSHGSSMTVQSGGTASADRIIFAATDAVSADVLVEGTDSRLSGNTLDLGGFSTNNRGGTGILTVTDNAVVAIAGATNFMSSTSSITVDNGGSFWTDQLTSFDGEMPTISISGLTALAVGVNNGSSTFGGLIEDAAEGDGRLTKAGSGTFEITGANTYSGGTVVTGGTLLVNNTSGSATGTGAVNVMYGGSALGGNGAISGDLFIGDGAKLTPGASAGELTVKNVILESGSTFEVELGGLITGAEYDVLSVLGNAWLYPGSLDVSLIDGFTLDFDQQFDIVDIKGIRFGEFGGLTEGALVSTLGGIDLFITYQAGDGNDIALYTTAIPEPASLALLGLGSLALFLREGRRTSKRTSEKRSA
ncbi:beta strand repeat-containing protein [Poriferisphaera sp. WC338]|uniref:beta strand repeat-containing protein n=1 Tax=Poriferisphaera sp. WC338 TaxID=3425129 RepID=UPI003D81A1F7